MTTPSSGEIQMNWWNSPSAENALLSGKVHHWY
jgi:hypothetical protein